MNYVTDINFNEADNQVLRVLVDLEFLGYEPWDIGPGGHKAPVIGFEAQRAWLEFREDEENPSITADRLNSLGLLALREAADPEKMDIKLLGALLARGGVKFDEDADKAVLVGLAVEYKASLSNLDAK